jgi:FMN phosphatase YigB (HAD superfamily)
LRSFIFDIGGVLINFSNKQLVEDFVNKTKCERERIERLFEYEMLYRVETGRISGAEFYMNYVKSAMPDLCYEEWLGVFEDHYTINFAGLNLLQKLNSEGKETYLLSNLAEFHKIAIERKFPWFFNTCKRNFLSYQMGFHKPEAEIFKILCNTIEQEPENCVFIDDVTANIEGAKKAGFMGIHFANDKIAEIRRILTEQ